MAASQAAVSLVGACSERRGVLLMAAGMNGNLATVRFWERVTMGVVGLLISITLVWVRGIDAQTESQQSELDRRQTIITAAQELPEVVADLDKAIAVLKTQQKANDDAHKRIEKNQDEILIELRKR